MCLGPHCQCHARQEFKGRGLVNVKIYKGKAKSGQRKTICVPCWTVAESARDMARQQFFQSADPVARFVRRDVSVGRGAPKSSFRRNIREEVAGGVGN
eukprot:1884075-Karenia_brevis.AAC.1